MLYQSLSASLKKAGAAIRTAPGRRPSRPRARPPVGGVNFRLAMQQEMH
jgi:hypothetical protein